MLEACLRHDGGFTTHDLARCRLAARLVALVYDWWNLFTRLVEPERHMEAQTSRLGQHRSLRRNKPPSNRVQALCQFDARLRFRSHFVTGHERQCSKTDD